MKYSRGKKRCEIFSWKKRNEIFSWKKREVKYPRQKKGETASKKRDTQQPQNPGTPCREGASHGRMRRGQPQALLRCGSPAGGRAGAVSRGTNSHRTQGARPKPYHRVTSPVRGAVPPVNRPRGLATGQVTRCQSEGPANGTRGPPTEHLGA